MVSIYPPNAFVLLFSLSKPLKDADFRVFSGNFIGHPQKDKVNDRTD